VAEFFSREVFRLHGLPMYIAIDLDCYPPFLGITKEMMSRGPQVADMEYREATQHTNPFIQHTSPFDDGRSIHHTWLGSPRTTGIAP
jgi:hypothetical protein